MHNSIFLSPPFIISGLITFGAAVYAYVYQPIQMRRAYRQSLLTLAQAVETKDTGALGHSERVAEWVVAVASEMEVSKRERRRMEYAAYLQDVGNVSVPSAILNKTDRLNSEEFELVKPHAEVGASMVEQVRFLRLSAPIIRHHHEAWDGSGYPAGLEGMEIPLGARILAVCTAYDSMVHSKAYRSRMTRDEAISIIKAMSGTKYDPHVVKVFLHVLRNSQN